MREQADALKDIADAPPQLVRRLRARRLAVDQHLARVRLEQPIDHLESRGLPEPDSPTIATNSPAGTEKLNERTATRES